MPGTRRFKKVRVISSNKNIRNNYGITISEMTAKRFEDTMLEETIIDDLLILSSGHNICKFYSGNKLFLGVDL